MNQLRCEMCGSTDLVKQDGMFVCQVCGAKYSIEEAKKMMIEGTVDVTGSTVKVDNTSFVQKYLANARRALDKQDWEEVEKYYNLVEQNSPNNMEAVFFSAYGKAMLSFTDQDYFKREQKVAVLNKSISVISDYFEVTDENKEEVLNKIAQYVENIVNVTYVHKVNGVGTGSEEWQMGLIISVIQSFTQELEQISALHKDGYILKLLERFKQKLNTINASLAKLAKKKDRTVALVILFGSLVFIAAIIFALI